MFDIVALGEILIDFTYYGESENGNILFEQNPGGAVANFLALGAGFGLKTAFIGKIGADMQGQFLRDVLKAKGINTTGLIETRDFFTTLAFVKIKEGERSFSFARKPGADTRLSFDEIDENIIKNTKVFHFGSLSLTDEPSKTATIKAVKLAKEHNVLISYDPNYRTSLWKNAEIAKKTMREGAKFADIIKISDEESEILTGYKEPEKAANSLLEEGASCVVVTLGENGAIVATSAGQIQKKTPKVEVIDTTGAGDTFFASFLYKIITSGKTLEQHSINQLGEYLEFANAAASICVGRRGAMPSMPSLAEVLERLGV